MTALRPIAACLALACALTFGATASASPSPMIDQINQVRRAHDLPTLRYSRSLSRSSFRYSRHLVRTGRFTHAPRIMASARFSTLGEILARTPGLELQRSRTLGGWLLSPTHRAVLLSRAFRYVGAGRALAWSGGDAATIWAVQFGNRR